MLRWDHCPLLLPTKNLRQRHCYYLPLASKHRSSHMSLILKKINNLIRDLAYSVSSAKAALYHNFMCSAPNIGPKNVACSDCAFFKPLCKISIINMYKAQIHYKPGSNSKTNGQKKIQALPDTYSMILYFYLTLKKVFAESKGTKECGSSPLFLCYCPLCLAKEALIPIPYDMMFFSTPTPAQTSRLEEACTEALSGERAAF